jgi:hypothetical protein
MPTSLPWIVEPSSQLPSLPRPGSPDGPDSTAVSPLVRILVVTALFALPLVVTLRPVGVPVIDPDIWWHLRVGQWVIDHGTVPLHDAFSQTGGPWVAYSWLYEVLVYGLYQALGLLGIVLYRAALAVAVTAALFRLVSRREPNFLLAALLTALGALAIAMLFSERPWLFTILFSTLTLDAILALREGRPARWTWLLPVCYALWASLHIQLIYGLLLLAAGCAAELIEGKWGRAGGDPRRLKRLLGLSLACFLATLCNPYHMRIYAVVLEYATQPGPFQYVNELKAPEYREPASWMTVALAGAAAFALGRRRQVDLFEVLVLIGAAVLAFRARRDLWCAVAVSLAILARWRQSNPPMQASHCLRLSQWVIVCLLLSCLAGLLVWARQLTPERLERTAAEVFPVEAARAVAERDLPGPLFNDFNWGGYLIWALPDRPVVVDGRTNLHGDERILRIGNVWAGGPGWDADSDLHAAKLVVADAQSPLAGLLTKDPRWRRVHVDPLATVFVPAP